jgi:hypothetical protein
MDAFVVQLLAIFGATLFLSIAVFEVLVSLGVPLGEFAWGGSHVVLPRSLRIASMAAAIIWIGITLIALERGGVVSVGLNSGVSRVLVWILTALLGLGAVMNALSRSKKERLVMTPVASLGFLVCLMLSVFGQGT